VKLHTFWAFSLLLLFCSAIWTTVLFVELGTLNPTVVLPAMVEDLENLGPWAILLDVIVFGGIAYLIWKRKGKEEPKSIWHTD
jgi:hypothetical protein